MRKGLADFPHQRKERQVTLGNGPFAKYGGGRFSTELVTFCKDFSPTMHELRRLLGVKLGASNWHKVSGKLRGEDYRRVSSSWTDETNANYCTAAAELPEAIKIAFPVHVGQNTEESVQNYYH
ncbi:Mannose-6-phosphate isomerase [Labeo rohita]|uniref:Mannose-6-phosphate isomerase n=1 Tax=Labeo rohita TaxID=84645 RepID=A0ABQ8LF79_LABRO|nr:Mannose-6-phosphate isomerase [Labeo rohita]